MARTHSQEQNDAALARMNGSASTSASKSTADKTADVASKAKRKAAKAAKTATKKVEGIAESAVEQTRSQVEQAAEQGLNSTEHFVSSFSRAAQAAGRSLQDDGMHRTAAYVNAAANGLDRAAHEVDTIDTSRVGSRVENIVRQNPLLTMGALAIAGFALAGAVKKSNSA